MRLLTLTETTAYLASATIESIDGGEDVFGYNRLNLYIGRNAFGMEFTLMTDAQGGNLLIEGF